VALLMLPAEEAWRISGEALFTRVRGETVQKLLSTG
jgi:hypothetical protein